MEVDLVLEAAVEVDTVLEVAVEADTVLEEVVEADSVLEVVAEVVLVLEAVVEATALEAEEDLDLEVGVVSEVGMEVAAGLGLEEAAAEVG